MEKEQKNYTRYEKARLIGSRALQLAQGAPMKVELSKKELEEIKYNPVEIATIEFEKGVLPITIKRTLPQENQKQEEKEK